VTTTPVRSAEHTTDLDAPAERAYRLIADVTCWPVLFAPCLAATVLSSDGKSERVQLWALAGAQVRSWTSTRELDAQALRVDFRQESPTPPVAAMSGHWRFEPGRLVLGHEWVGTTGSREEDDLIGTVLERNSTAEIGAVKSWAEHGVEPDELIFSFVDHLSIKGSAVAVYDFLHRADLWPRRLSHVESLDLMTEPETAAGAEVQTLEMRTLAGDGSAHLTRSVRLCFPHQRIVYKQTAVPRGLLGHSGEWLITSTAEGTDVTARHRVALDPAALTEVFGSGSTPADARRIVRERLGGNSLLTLTAAKRFIEGGVR